MSGLWQGFSCHTWCSLGYWTFLLVKAVQSTASARILKVIPPKSRIPFISDTTEYWQVERAKNPQNHDRLNLFRFPLCTSHDDVPRTQLQYVWCLLMLLDTRVRRFGSLGGCRCLGRSDDGHAGVFPSLAPGLHHGPLHHVALTSEVRLLNSEFTSLSVSRCFALKCRVC